MELWVEMILVVGCEIPCTILVNQSKEVVAAHKMLVYLQAFLGSVVSLQMWHSRQREIASDMVCLFPLMQ